MKVTDVGVMVLSWQIPEGEGSRSDFGLQVKIDVAVVVITTDEGIVGHGAAHGAVPAIKTIVEQQLKPMLLGEDPTEIERLWHKMYTGSRHRLSLEEGRAYPIQGRRGETISAISGVDIALWDITGKAWGQPVYRLLGGPCRTRIRTYASGGWKPPGEAGAEMAGYVAKGFTGVKMRVGGMDSPSLETSAERVREAREAIGPDALLMIDAHGSLGVASAIKLATMVEEYDIRWFEEPVSGDDIPGMAEVRQATSIPIAAGESEFTRWGFRELLEGRAVDILQPDVAVCGGITECKRIADMASAWNLQYAPHVWFQGVLFAASLQLAAAVPNCYIFEVSQSNNPLIYELTTEPFSIRSDGTIELPDKPGLGIDLIPDAEQRFPYVPGPNHIPW